MNEHPSIPVITRREQAGLVRSRSRRLGTIAARPRVAFAVLAADIVLSWLLMTAAGILHAQWWHAVPAMSYATAFEISGLLLAAIAVIGILVDYAGRA